MKYYSAVVNEDEIAATTIMPPYNILASYHYFKNKIDVIRKSVDSGHDVFIDSGAFSAENSGKAINLDDYCLFLKECKATYYASLDVIGDAKATMENYEYMVQKYGLKPILAFHMGSELKDLDIILKKQEIKYIALGGLVFSSGISQHCDEVWAYILRNRKGLRVHGFGLTNIELMQRYPWYSVDSSSFKSCKRFGRQGIIFDGFNFKTFAEEDYITILNQMGYNFPSPKEKKLLDKEQITAINKKLWAAYDYHSSQSYKLFAEHLKVINKTKDFSYLTCIDKLFPEDF